MSRDKIEKWDEVNGITAPERNLEVFLESSTDTYAILQLRDSEDTRYERFDLTTHYRSRERNRRLTIMMWFIWLRFHHSRTEK